jgi:hypothetical protein
LKLCIIWSTESLDEEGTPIRDEGSVTYSECLCAGYHCGTFSLRLARLERSYAPPLPPSASYRRARGWGPVDLEHRRRSVSRCHPDCGPLSRQAALERSRKSSLRSQCPTGCSMGGTSEGRTRHRKSLGVTHCHPSPGVPLRGRALLSSLFPDQPRAYALSGVPCARLVHFHRRGGGCKVAIGTRLKRAGMHWTVRRFNAIIALRCSKLSGRFQDFRERRSERRAA